MLLQRNYNYSVSFTGINLNDKEKEKTDVLLKQLEISSNRGKIKTELLDIFDKHIKKEAESKSSAYFYIKDYLQKMYLAFFDAIENSKQLSSELLIEILNGVKPQKEEKKELFRFDTISLDSNIRHDIDKPLKLFLTEKNLPVYKSSASPEEREEHFKKIQTLRQNVDLSTREEDVLYKVSVGKNFKQLSKEKDLCPTLIRNNFLSSVAKIQDGNDILPEEYNKFADKLINNLELDVSKSYIKKILIKNAYLLNFDTDKIIEKIKTTSKSLNIDNKTYFSILTKRPSLLTEKPGTILNNINKTAEMLEISPDQYIPAALKQPQLFYQKPETIAANIRKTAKLLDIEISELVRAALKNPSVFYQKPETLAANINQSAEALRLTPAKFLKTALRHPPLFSQKSETISGNILRTSELLNIPIEKLTQLAADYPSLFYQKPETITGNINKGAKLLNIDTQEYLNAALKDPSLFYQKPESIVNKAKIIKYYKQVQGKNSDKTVFAHFSESRLYIDILNYLIKKFDGLNKAVERKELVEYLKKQNKIYEFNIPFSEVTEKFIQYVKDFSKSNFGKQIFSFNILK